MKIRHLPAPAQDTLYHLGVADIMIGGLYKGYYSFETMKQYGDFGIGAPDQLDGEMVMVDGIVYQTHHTGVTVEASNDTRAALAFIHFFEKDSDWSITSPATKQFVYAELTRRINRNEPTAIRLEGNFDYICTRAFPPVTNYPAPGIPAMADRQRFFVYHNMGGTLIGYYIPSFMQGINVAGFHFHFLSHDKQGGGHVLDFHLQKGQVQLDVVYNLGVLLPPVPEFPQFAPDR